MKKNILYFIMLLSVSRITFAQVGIGTTNLKATLDVVLAPTSPNAKKIKPTATAVDSLSHQNSFVYSQKNKIIGYTKPVFANQTSISYQNRPPPSVIARRIGCV